MICRLLLKAVVDCLYQFLKSHLSGYKHYVVVAAVSLLHGMLALILVEHHLDILHIPAQTVSQYPHGPFGHLFCRFLHIDSF